MKFEKKHLAAGVAAACSFLSAATSQAAGSQIITVSASVTGTCQVQSGSASSIALTVDPTLTTAVSNSGTVLYRCTKGTTPTVSLSSANTNVLKGPSPATTESFAYSSSSTGSAAGTGFGAGQDKTVTVAVTVTQSNAALVSAGTYTDNLTVTINP